MDNLSRTELRILKRVSSRGSDENLLALASDLEIPYSHASRSLLKLERLGILSVQHRGRGVPMILKPADGFLLWPEINRLLSVARLETTGRQAAGDRGAA